MATEFLYATSHIAGDFPNPNNAIGDTPGTWAGELNSNADRTSRWAIGNPSEALTGTQTIRVLARKGSNSGDPTIQLNLYENGSLVQALGSNTTISSTSGQIISRSFSAASISNPDNIEIEVIATAIGGNPNTRNSPQIAYIEYEASVIAVGPPTEAPVLTLVSKSSQSFEVEASTVSGAVTYEFQVDLSTTQNNDSQSLVQSELDPETAYDVRCRAVNTEGEGPWSDTLQVITDAPPGPFGLSNTFEGGTPETVITPENSGGASGDPFDSVWVNASEFTDEFVAHGDVAAKVINPGPGIMVWSGFSEPVLYSRVYVLHTWDDPGNQVFLEEIIVYGGGGDFWVEFFPTVENGNFVLLSVPALGISGSVNIPATQWVRIEMLVDTNIEYLEVRLYLDPESEVPDEVISGNLVLAAGDFTHVWWGNYDGGAGFIYYDEVALGNQDWLGPISTGEDNTRQITSVGDTGTSDISRVGSGERANLSEGRRGFSTANAAITPGSRSVISTGLSGTSLGNRIGIGGRKATSEGANGFSEISRIGNGNRLVLSEGEIGLSVARITTTATRQVGSSGEKGNSLVARKGIGDRKIVSAGLSGSSNTQRTAAIETRQVISLGAFGNSESHRMGFGNRETTSTGSEGLSLAKTTTSAFRLVSSVGVEGFSTARRIGTGNRETISIGFVGASFTDRAGFGNRETLSLGFSGVSFAHTVTAPQRDITIAITGPLELLAIGEPVTQSRIEIITANTRWVIAEGGVKWSIASPVIDRELV